MFLKSSDVFLGVMSGCCALDTEHDFLLFCWEWLVRSMEPAGPLQTIKAGAKLPWIKSRRFFKPRQIRSLAVCKGQTVTRRRFGPQLAVAEAQ